MDLIMATKETSVTVKVHYFQQNHFILTFLLNLPNFQV